MAAARTLISDLPKGHTFSPATFTLTGEDVSKYLDAVEDHNAIYRERGLAPPLAAAARGLGALLEALELAPGTLHTNQEIDVRGGVRIDALLTLSGRIAQRSERPGMVICAIEFELTHAGASSPALTGRTTVLVPSGSGGAS
jgi:hypothetical protein